MILYHFTPLKTANPRGGAMRREDGSPVWFPGDTRSTEGEGLVEIMLAPEGLTPEPGNGTGWGALNIPGAPEVVWLTGNPRTVSSPNGSIVRITVKILQADRRLINWRKWRSHHMPGFDPELPLKGMDRDWWGYAGTIPLSRIVGIEYLRDQKTLWDNGG
jgi:hypothetical protein